MKPIIITISILLAGLTIATLNLRTTNAELKEQLQTALGYREQLNEQAEEYTRQRMEWNARLAELETQLLSTATQLNNLSEALQEAREQVNPDYELLLERARREVALNNPPRQRREGGMNVLSDPDAAFTIAEASVDSNYSDFFDVARLSPTERETVGGHNPEVLAMAVANGPDSCSCMTAAPIAIRPEPPAEMDECAIRHACTVDSGAGVPGLATAFP